MTLMPEPDKKEKVLEIHELKSAVEALLFSSDKPLSVTYLAKVLDGAERKVVHGLLDELRSEYDDQSRGFRLVEIAEGWQILSRPQHAGFIRRMNRTKGLQRITRAALETLAIIAYKQPLTKGEIEQIRGVNSDAVVNSLLERKLIRTVGRKDVVGRPLLYGTTAEFLEAFGLKDLSEMPALTELNELLKAEEDSDLFEVGDDGRLREKDIKDFLKDAGESGAGELEEIDLDSIDEGDQACREPETLEEGEAVPAAESEAEDGVGDDNDNEDIGNSKD